MLYFDRIYVSEGIYVKLIKKKIKGCDICHFLAFFSRKGLSFNHMYAIDVMIY